MHREAEGQEWTSDCSSGAKEGRDGADESETEPTGVWLLSSADGSQIQVYLSHTWVCTPLSMCQTSLRYNQSIKIILICFFTLFVQQRGVWGGLQRASDTLWGQKAAKCSSADRPSRCLNAEFHCCLSCLTLSHATQFESRIFSLSEPAGGRQQTDSPSARLRKMGTEELSTSFSTTGVTEAAQTHTSQR